MRKIKRLSDLIKGHLNDDNLHRVAISNLKDHERQVIRWWTKKYRTPEKPLHEHTMEELVLEMLEDYYEANPVEIERFLNEDRSEEQWDGSVPAEYEKGIQHRLKKLRQVDISQYQSDEALTPEQEVAIIENLGRNLPKSRSLPIKQESTPTLGTGEFDEDFGE